jgi:hypothetical protein
VNARYNGKDYTASMAAKNDFILVAEVNGHVVGFVQYYFQNFTGNLTNTKHRATPKPIIYVATLQTATSLSHPEYAASCLGKKDARVKVKDKSQEEKEEVFGAEPRTGVLLMALAIAHAFTFEREALFIDSTVSAVPFYRRFFNMQCSMPVC